MGKGIKMYSVYQEYNNNFKEIFDNSFDYVYLHDTQGKILDINEIVVRNLGYSREEILSMKVIEFLSIVENPAEIKKTIKSTIQTGKVNKPRIYRVKKKNGEITYLEVNTIPLKKNGKIYAILGIGHDVTKYKNVEQKLRESEKKYYTLFNNSTSGIAYHKIIYDEKEKPIDYIITDVSPQFEEILSLKKEDVVNKRSTDTYDVESAPFLETYSKVADTGESTSFESFFPPLNKYFRISVISQKKGEFITVFDDITERINAEYKLKEHSQELYALNRIITLGNESKNLQEFLEKSYDQILDLVGFDRGGVYIYDTETQHNKLVLHKNVHTDFIAAVKDVDISTGLFKQIFDKNKPFYIEDFSRYMENSKELGVYSAVIVPLNSKEEYVGSMNIASPVNKILSKYELDLLVGIGKQMGIIIQKFKSEKLLKESEEKFRTMAEQSFMGIIIIQDGLFKYYNQRAAEINGYSLEEINSWKAYEFSKLIHPDDREFVINQARKKQIGEKDVVNQYSYRIIKKNGETIWVENFSKTINYKGKPADFVMTVDITEKIESEKKLKESEEKFRTLAEQSLMGIGILQDYKLKYANKRFATLFGYTVDEMLQIDFIEFLQLIHEEDREKIAKQVDRRMDRTRETITFYHFRAYKKSGELFWVEVFSKIIYYQGERASLITLLDITDMKMAEIKLKESEEKYRKLFEDSPIALMEQDYSGMKDYLDLLKASGIIDFEKFFDDNPEEVQKIMSQSNSKIVDVNKKCLEVYKANSKEDLILRMKKRFKDEKGVADEVLLFNKNEILSLIEGKTIYESEITSKTLTGDTIFLYVKTSIMPGFESTWSKVIVSLIDITENKFAEVKLKESEEQFRTISEQSFMGIVIAQEGKLKYLNKAMSKISGYPVEEMLKWTDRDMAKMVHPEDVQTILNRLRSNIEGTVSDFSHNAFRIINKEGQIKWLEDYTSKIIYQGKLANLISVVDVTDKIEAEKLILEENKRLLELHELRKDLITRVSHELKTPMTSIYGGIQILLSVFKDKLDKEVLNYVEIGHRGCIRLKQLIENLLDTSRLESKKLELNLEKKNLVPLLKECVDDMTYLGNLRNISMNSVLPTELYFNIDHLRFRQVLTNIISNAIKNTPRGGKVFITANEESKFIDIHVRDTGVGLTASEKERLFEKFGKIERYGMDLDVDIEGVGIGLHISKELVELHGGEILVESKGRNKGATFTIRLYKEN